MRRQRFPSRLCPVPHRRTRRPRTGPEWEPGVRPLAVRFTEPMTYVLFPGHGMGPDPKRPMSILLGDREIIGAYASLREWDEGAYEAQWASALDHLRAGGRSACIVTTGVPSVELASVFFLWRRLDRLLITRGQTPGRGLVERLFMADPSSFARYAPRLRRRQRRRRSMPAVMAFADWGTSVPVASLYA